MVEVGINAATGAIAGAISATGIGATGAALVSSALDGIEYMAIQTVNGEDIHDGELIATMVLGGITSGKGIDSSKLRGIYKHSKDMLNRAMSQARKDFYQANVNEVKNKFFNAITSAIKDGAVSVVVDVLDYYSGFAALRG